MKNFYYYNKSKKKWSKKFSDFLHKLISNQKYKRYIKFTETTVKTITNKYKEI